MKSPLPFLILLISLLYVSIDCYIISKPLSSASLNRGQRLLQSSSPVSSSDLQYGERTAAEEPCYWKPSWENSRWQRRIHMDDLQVGQKLNGTIVQELLDGKTGPKLFLEVGAGKTDSEGKWKMVFAMARLPREKAPVTRKRVARLRKRDSIDIWISRVQRGCGRLEVCFDEEDVERYREKPKRSITTVQKGEEVQGNVVRVEDYGVLVDIGVNRPGLLHILKVRTLYGKYIDGKKGLIEAGLERGAKVRLCVDSNVKRRLSLDFTDDVKEAAKSELAASLPKIPERDIQPFEDVPLQADSSMMSEDLAEWAAFAAAASGEGSVIDDHDDGDDYDEDRDIEDSLGLGFY